MFTRRVLHRADVRHVQPRRRAGGGNIARPKHRGLLRDLDRRRPGGRSRARELRRSRGRDDPVRKYGFLDDTAPGTFCKLMHMLGEMEELGYGFLDLLFYKNGDIFSPEVYDVVLCAEEERRSGRIGGGTKRRRRSTMSSTGRTPRRNSGVTWTASSGTSTYGPKRRIRTTLTRTPAFR